VGRRNGGDRWGAGGTPGAGITRTVGGADNGGDRMRATGRRAAGEPRQREAARRPRAAGLEAAAAVRNPSRRRSPP
jgi:hypothetical protein